jgi:hypothetical protein
MFDQAYAELQSEANAAWDDHYERWADMRAEAEAAARWADEDAEREQAQMDAWWEAFDPSGELRAAYDAYWRNYLAAPEPDAWARQAAEARELWADAEPPF